MPPVKHARLSPSSADRWIHCPGSVALSEQLPEPESTVYADEGTLAHAVAELKISKAIGELPTRQYNRLLSYRKKEPFWCAEMDEATDYYKDVVIELLAASGADAELLVEQRFSLDKWVPESFGTSDAVIIGGRTVHVIDLKYGKGVRVDAQGNAQLRLYALGATELFRELYDIETVRMTIIQPRLDHVSTEELPYRELMFWGTDEVMPRAKMAAEGSEHYECGDWCRWCPAKAVCRERARINLSLAIYEFRQPGLLTEDEIADILSRAEELSRWAADVQAYALDQALAGEHYDGWKLVEGRSTRKYADDLKVADALKAAGYEEALLYERKLYGITAMEKIVGKKKLTEILGDLIIKPAGKPVLVPASDKREEINTAAAAAADFKED